MTSTMFTCPIDGCDWTYTDDGLQPPETATPDDLQALHAMHFEVVQSELLAHYETHPTAVWIDMVAKLRHELAGARAPLLCAGCLSDRHQAQQAGLPLPPQQPAQVIVNGSGVCVGHVTIGGPQQLPGRTGGGLIVPGMPIPPVNGS